MTPSIEERREVAERLRYIGRSGGPEWGTAACCIAECVARTTTLFGAGAFRCSRRAHLEVDGDTDANLLVGGERPMPNYCPNCGAKVEVGK